MQYWYKVQEEHSGSREAELQVVLMQGDEIE
jgi:hypothetical protein